MLDQPQWLERTEFASVSDRLKNRVMLDELISAETQKYTVAQLLRKLLEAKLPAGELNTVEQVVHHPHFQQARQIFVEVEHPRLGPVTVTNLPIHMSETQPRMYRCAPCLGEDTVAVLSGLG